jgi:ATP phosphoribosyltransferase regulatory subunit
VARLCYCGPVLHTRPAGPNATREPLQFGAEVYGHSGLEADLEVIELALDSLKSAGIEQPVLDLGDARVVRGVLAGADIDTATLDAVIEALSSKDTSALDALAQALPAPTRAALKTLPSLYGGIDVLDAARSRLPRHGQIVRALDDLAWLAAHLQKSHPQVRIGFDLGDVGGYAYYSGARFAVYGAGSSDALLRGGRYDEVGAVFGRNRPAVGFSLDLKALAECAKPWPLRAAVRAPWAEDASLRAAIRRLRDAGETVVCILPGHEHEGQEFDCDRELVAVDGQWTVRAL